MKRVTLIRYPFLSWWAISLLATVLLRQTIAQYDDGSLASFLWLTYGLWGFLHWFPAEVIGSEFPDLNATYVAILSLFFGILIAISLDFLIRRFFQDEYR